jgi:hypothetical protein
VQEAPGIGWRRHHRLSVSEAIRGKVVTPETRAFEYALGLFSVLIGLAVADIAASFHRLARGKAPVVWDPLTLLAAVYALWLAVGMWFELWGVRNVSEARHFFFYMGMIAQLFVLFLIAAASLPDDPAEGGDLRTYYARNKRYFWLLVALFQTGYIAFGIYFAGGMLARMPRSSAALMLCAWALCFVTPLALAVLRSRMVHYLGLALLFAVQAWHYAPYMIN